MNSNDYAHTHTHMSDETVFETVIAPRCCNSNSSATRANAPVLPRQAKDTQETPWCLWIAALFVLVSLYYIIISLMIGCEQGGGALAPERAAAERCRR